MWGSHMGDDEKNTLLEFATHYHKTNLNVIPLVFGDKRPAVESWRLYYEQKVPSPMIIEWFSNNKRNIGIICGEVSDNLMVLDFDKANHFTQLVEWLSKNNLDDYLDTWIVKTGKGFHIYYRLEDPQPLLLKRELFDGIELRGRRAYVVAPPSKHPTGSFYEFVKGPYMPIKLLSNKQFAKLLVIMYKLGFANKTKLEELYDYVKSLDPTIKFTSLAKISQDGKGASKTTSSTKQETRSLILKKDIDVHKIYSLLKDFYIVGHQHNILSALFGYFARAGVDIFKAVELLALFVKDPKNNPSHKHSRIDQLTYTYARVWGQEYGVRVEDVYGPGIYEKLAEYTKPLLKETEISWSSSDFRRGLVSSIEGKTKGKQSLTQELVNVMINEFSVEENEAKDKAVAIINEISKILGVSMDHVIMVSKTIGEKTWTFYANDPTRGIVLISYTPHFTKIKGREVIFGYYLKEATMKVNPDDTTDRVFTLVFAYPKEMDNDLATLKFEDVNIGPLTKALAETQVGVRNSARLRDALSSILEAFMRRGLLNVEFRAPATGFFEINGELQFFEVSKFRVNHPKPTNETVKEAINKLRELLEFYRFNDKALANIYFDVQSPLGFIRKRYGYENKILFNFGASHVGKTLVRKLGAYIWGIREDKVIRGGSKINANRLAEYLNETTFPITIDEVKNALARPDIYEMLKNSTTNTHIKSRILPHQNFRVAEFYAYGSIATTTNYVPLLGEEFIERIIPVEWDISDKRANEEVELFQANLATYKDELAYIGSYLRDMFIRRWDEVSQIIIGHNQVENGRKLLLMMFEELDLDTSWLRQVKLEYEIEQPSEKDLVLSTIRSDLIDMIHTTKPHLFENTWEDRIRYLGSIGALPPYMMVGTRSAYFDVGVVHRTKERTGYEVAGSLKSLALITGWKLYPKSGKKVIAVPIEQLAKELEQTTLVIEEEEEEIEIDINLAELVVDHLSMEPKTHQELEYELNLPIDKLKPVLLYLEKNGVTYTNNGCIYLNRSRAKELGFNIV